MSFDSLVIVTNSVFGGDLLLSCSSNSLFVVYKTDLKFRNSLYKKSSTKTKILFQQPHFKSILYRTLTRSLNRYPPSYDRMGLPSEVIHGEDLERVNVGVKFVLSR